MKKNRRRRRRLLLTFLLDPLAPPTFNELFSRTGEEGQFFNLTYKMKKV